MKKTLKILFLCIVFLEYNLSQAQITYTLNTTPGTWETTTHWTPNGLPTSNDSVVIPNGRSVTINSAAQCRALNMQGGGTAHSVTISSGSLTVVNAVTINAPTSNVTKEVKVGSCTLNCGSISLTGGSTSKISQISISTGTVNCKGSIAFGGGNTKIVFSGAGRINIQGNLGSGCGTFTKSTSTINFNGTTAQTLAGYDYNIVNINNKAGVTLSSISANITTLNIANDTAGAVFSDGMNTITTAGTCNLNNGTYNCLLNGTFPWTTFNCGTGTVIFGSNTNQNCNGKTFYNLTLTNSGVKTTTGVTVNNILTVSGEATGNAAPTFGANATLLYYITSERYIGSEWASPFSATGGVIITGTHTLKLNSAKVFNAGIPLTINTGATLSTDANYQLTFGGDFIKNGTLIANASNIVIDGTAATQNISGFTTTGTVSMTKTSGTATFTGNVSATNLTINGAGGTLNLGTGLTHTVSGTWTRTAGTLNSGSSILRLGGSISGSGGSFNANTGTVEYYANGNQNVATLSYNNLILSGSGTKILLGATTISGNFEITSSAIADLGTFTSTTNTLSFDNLSKPAGSYGGTGSSATYINTTYFAANSGILNVAICPAGIWLGSTNTDWHTASNWCDGNVPNSLTDVTIYPAANQPVISAAAACKSLTLLGGSSAISLTISGSNTLAITNGITINAPTASVDKVISIGSGTLSCSSITLNATTTGTAQITVSTGSVNVTGNISFAGTASKFIFTGAGTLNIGGNLGSGGTFTKSSGTVNFNGSSAQTFAGYDYNSIKCNNTAGITPTADPTITTLTIADVTGNSVFNDGGYSISTASTLNLNSGTYNCSASSLPWATVNTGTGTINYSKSGTQTCKDITYYNLIISCSGTKTKTGNLTVSNNLTITGGTFLLQGSSNNVTGSTTITGGTFKLNPSSTTATFNSNIILNGGTITTDAITTNTNIINTGTLQLTNNSTIILNTNVHSISFAASNSVSWTGSKALTIYGWLGTGGSSGTGGRIYIGNNSSGLTAGQLAQINFDGAASTLLGTGELVPTTTPPPFSGAEMAVKYLGITINDGDNTPSTTDGTDFGMVFKRTLTHYDTVTRTFTISSSGLLTLSLTSTPTVSITGAAAGDFFVSQQPSSTSLNNGESTTFIVKFYPKATGARIAEITISSNDADRNPYNFTIQGTGRGFNCPTTCATSKCYTVTTTATTGAGSFPTAITQANSNTIDTIVFNITGGTPPYTISNTVGYTLSDPVVICGNSQPAGSYTGVFPKIGLTTASGGLTGLTLASDNIEIWDLTIAGYYKNIYINNNVKNCLIKNCEIISSTSSGPGIECYGGDNNWILYNFIGVRRDSITAAGNTGNGIILQNSACNNVIHGNIISSNSYQGIQIAYSDVSNDNSSNNIITGNVIGTSGASVCNNIGNGYGGITLGTSNWDYTSNASNNIIGTTIPGYGNIIANNCYQGIFINARSANNSVRGNMLFNNYTSSCNYTSRSFDLDDNYSPNGNNNHQPPVMQNANADSAWGTGHPGDIVDVYIDQRFSSSTNCNIKIYNGTIWIGSATVNSSGYWRVYKEDALYGRIVVTATDPNGNTSEFAGLNGNTSAAVDTMIVSTIGPQLNCKIEFGATGAPVPVMLLDFKGKYIGNNQIQLKWETLVELNCDFYEIERSTSYYRGFEYIGKVKGNGTTTISRIYHYTDQIDDKVKVIYYRLKQYDYDGTYTYSKIIAVVVNDKSMNCDMSVFPNPSYGYINISFEHGVIKGEVLVVLLDMYGKTVYSKVFVCNEEGPSIIAIDLQNKLPAGIYLVMGSNNDVLYKKKIIIQ